MEEIYKQMRDLANLSTVEFIVPKAPARWEPAKTGGVVIVDYICPLRR